MPEKLLSISIAAYNVEKYIRQCLNSFTSDSLKKYMDELEVIITDDGSTDATPQIVREYVIKYPGTFILIQQENAGPGSTMNSGLRYAHGLYFKLLDGDDWYNSEELVMLLEEIRRQKAQNRKTDMICTMYSEVLDGTDKTRPYMYDIPAWNKELLLSDAMDYFLSNKLLLPMHAIAYRTELLKETVVGFDNGFYTDMEFVMFPLPFAVTVKFLPYNVYQYRIGRDGQSISIDSLSKRSKEHYKILTRLISDYRGVKDQANDEVLKYMAWRIAQMAGTQLSIYLCNRDKENARIMVRYIRAMDADIYNNLFEMETFRLLIKTNFLTFPLVAAIHRKRVSEKTNER